MEDKGKNPTHSARLSVAPMMDWTDRHCRVFHRMISAEALLYTEMVTSAALIRGDARHLLGFSEQEQPVALQLGGSDPAELALAARLGADEGYGEINLNVGCPSDRVQSGSFGAILMKSPALVGECVAAMRAAQGAEVTVKCRIGVDDQEPAEILPAFLETMVEAGVTRLTIHARKAWLQGLSPKQNRDVPPLDYELVYAMKRAFPDLHISINGGVETLAQAQSHLEAGMDGVMIGRAAYHQPYDILSQVDAQIFGRETPPVSRAEIIARMEPYIAAHLAAGGKLSQITRHMIGLFAGLPGARQWRRVLSEKGQGFDVGLEVLHEALGAVQIAA
ncbi:MAG: tRNA-dihydrouridine synthase A [Halocynthiibacter sp.]|jgi:tRNA-dihydrouridine synthase A